MVAPEAVFAYLSLTVEPPLTDLSPPRASIDLAALKSNFEALAARVAPRGVLAVVKWNAYGHGLIECSKVLDQAGATAFGVSSPKEGIELRKAGISKPILVMTDWVGKPLKHFLDFDLSAAATSKFKLDYLESASKKLGRAIPVHIKFDTGLGRVGMPAESAEIVFKHIAAGKYLNIAAIYSHLAYRGPQDHERGLQQIDLFNRIVKMASDFGIEPRWIHLANSAAALALPDVPGNLVRTGIALYGQPPSLEVAELLPLKPVMNLIGTVAEVRKLKKGFGFPSPQIWRAPFDGYGAEINLGFSTNYPRSFANRAHVLHNGKRVPLVGVISKDKSYIFLHDRPHIGDEVVFWGWQNGNTIFLYELAPLIDCLPYELTTWLSPKLPRKYI